MGYKNFKIHIKTISHHKHLVRKLCFRAGMYKQGMLHDLSKWSITELKNGWSYADGTKSPIDIERKKTGSAPSWLHHFHNNKHHYEYWYDSSIGKCYDMPDKYIYESALDRIAAAMNYQKDKYTDASAFDYFVKSTNDPYRMGYWNCLRLFLILLTVREWGLEVALDLIEHNNYANEFWNNPEVIQIVEKILNNYFDISKFN